MSEYFTVKEGFWFDTTTPVQGGQTPVQGGPITTFDQLNAYLSAKVDCQTVQGQWSPCYISKDAAGNDIYVRSRTDSITQYPRNGGAACPTSLTTTEPCTSSPCTYTDWSNYSDCFANDGINPQFPTSQYPYVQIRTRNINQAPVGTGQACSNDPWNYIQYTGCPTQACQYTTLTEEKSPWSSCYQDPTTKQYKQVRQQYELTSPARYGGTCPIANELLTYRNCSPTAGDQCTVSDWSPYTNCFFDDESKTYRRMRYRTVTKPATNGATCDAQLVEYDEKACAPVPCQYEDWKEDWSNCYLTTDGVWKKYRTRGVVDVNKYGAPDCDVNQLFQEQPCDPVPCTYTDPWKDYNNGACYTKPDGSKYKIQYRDFVEPINGGTPCVENQYIREAPCL